MALATAALATTLTWPQLSLHVEAHGTIDQASLAFPDGTTPAFALPDGPAYIRQTFVPQASTLIGVDLGLGAFQPELCADRDEDITLAIVYDPPGPDSTVVVAQTTRNVAADPDEAEFLVITHFHLQTSLVPGGDYELRVSGSNCLHLWLVSEAAEREFVFATYAGREEEEDDEDPTRTPTPTPTRTPTIAPTPAATFAPNLGGAIAPLFEAGRPDHGGPGSHPSPLPTTAAGAQTVRPPSTGDGGLW